MLPESQLGQKTLPFGPGPDRHNPKKKVSQMFGIRPFRLASAPGETLALNMDQATLDRDPWPQPAKHLEQVGISVHCGTPRGQTPGFQVRAKSQQVFGTFRNIVSSHEEPIALGIHHCKDSSAPFQEGAIENNMAIGRKVSSLLRRTIQPVFQDPTDRRYTTTALFGQLLDRIAFLNPPLEPNALPDMPIRRDPPPEGLPTSATAPALLFTPIFPIALDSLRVTVWTALFCSSILPKLNLFNFSHYNTLSTRYLSTI